MFEKKELRKNAKIIRSSLDVKTISEKIVENIFDLNEFKQANNIMIFYPIGHEVNLLGLLKNESTKNFYLPKVQGENLLVCPYKIGDELVISKFKTEEPTSEAIDPDLLDLIFVPALMVDSHNHRLGYGGGFYDKFFYRHTNMAQNATKIVAIPSALMVDKLPSESFDAKIDIVITEIKR